MPSYRCEHPTCVEYIRERGYCPDHANGQRSDARTFYDQHLRNPESKRFYDSAAWQRARRSKLAAQPVCEATGCGKLAEHVHHDAPILDAPSRRLDPTNLVSLCAACHARLESERRRGAR
jgi:5-methylcytosine-specific restriction protein A